MAKKLIFIYPILNEGNDTKSKEYIDVVFVEENFNGQSETSQVKLTLKERNSDVEVTRLDILIPAYQKCLRIMFVILQCYLCTMIKNLSPFPTYYLVVIHTNGN